LSFENTTADLDEQQPDAPFAARRSRVLLILGTVAFFTLVFVLLYVGFRAERGSTLEITRERVLARAQALDARFGELSYEVNSMRYWAEEAFNGPPLPDHPLLATLHDIPGTKAYGLENVPTQLRAEAVGNIFGRGSTSEIPSSLLREINLALWLFPQHRTALAANRELVSVHYNSFSHMFAVSPWISHKELLTRSTKKDVSAVLDQATSLDALRMGLPERNPSRQPYWTALYDDPAGRGLMITHAAPVYQGNTPRGVVGVDISLAFLNYFVRRTPHDSGLYYIVGTASEEKGEQLVLGQSGMVAAASDPLSGRMGSGNFDAVARRNGWSWNDVATLTASSIGQLGGDYVIASPLSKAPWMLVYVLPVSEANSVALKNLRPSLGLTLIFFLMLGVMSFVLLRQHRHLTTVATHDALTGTLNRQEFLNAINREWARRLRNGQELSLLIVDVDHFKQLNDTHGMLGGDRILSTLVHTIATCVRAGDLVGRLGSKTFGVALPATNQARAEQVAERLRASISSHTSRISGLDVRFTVSVGIAWARPEDTDGTDLMRRANRALLAAKRRGKNRVASYNPDAMPPLSAAPHSEWQH